MNHRKVVEVILLDSFVQRKVIIAFISLTCDVYEQTYYKIQ